MKPNFWCSVPNGHDRDAKCAFTLVELLVCLAIIAVLVALVAVALARAGAKAQQVRCLNNLRQHGVSLALFLSEQNSYPLLLNPGQRFPDHGFSLWDALSTHGLGPPPSDSRAPNSVYFCPALVKQLKGDVRLDNLVALYGYNMEGLNGGGTNLPLGVGLNWDAVSGSFNPVNESQVIAPSPSYVWIWRNSSITLSMPLSERWLNIMPNDSAAKPAGCGHR